MPKSRIPISVKRKKRKLNSTLARYNENRRNEKVLTEVKERESEGFAGQLDHSIPPPSTDGESVVELSYTHSFVDSDTQGVDERQGTSEDEGWDAEAEAEGEGEGDGSQLERPGGVFEDTLELFGRYLASILRQLPDTPCYSLQQKFIDEAISARLSFGPSASSGCSPTLKGPQPPEYSNKQPLPADSSLRTWPQSKKTRAQKNKTSNTPSSAEAPVPPAPPSPPLVATKIKEEVVDEETFDETNYALDDQDGGIDIEEHELLPVKPEVNTKFELIMCDGFNQGSTGLQEIEENTISTTPKEKPPPYTCLICYKTFVRSSGLKNHCRDKHPVCDSNLKSKSINQNEQPPKRPCLEGNRQMPTGILEKCLVAPGGNPVFSSLASTQTTPVPTQKRLLFLVSNKPQVSPVGLVPSHTHSITSISSAIPGPPVVPGTNPSPVSISNNPGSSIQSQQSSSIQSVDNQSLLPDSQYDAR